MPTAKIIGRHRFFFFSKENNEPPHIHVEAPKMRPSFGFHRLSWYGQLDVINKELRQVRELVEENAGFFLEKWYEQPRNT